MDIIYFAGLDILLLMIGRWRFLRVDKKGVNRFGGDFTGGWEDGW